MSAVISALVHATFTGNNLAGTISVPGLQAGDPVVLVQDLGGGALYPSSGSFYFETVISTDDQLQQSANIDLSSHTFKIYVFRGS